jgi:nucleoid-associated protein YgaU
VAPTGAEVTTPASSATLTTVPAVVPGTPTLAIKPTPRSTAIPALLAAAPANDYTVAAVIAQRVYGDSAEWEQVYTANRQKIGPDPNLLPVGIHLQLPAR